MADGTTFDVQAGPAVKNFAQIKVGDVVTASQDETVAIAVVRGDKAPPAAQRRVDLCICLDTSNSMDGLIDSAKAKLWAIVNELATARPRPIPARSQPDPSPICHLPSRRSFARQITQRQDGQGAPLAFCRSRSPVQFPESVS
jgi:hypothetical protein